MALDLTTLIESARQLLKSYGEIITPLSTVAGALVGYYFRNRSERVRTQMRRTAAERHLASQLENVAQHYTWTIEELPGANDDAITSSIKLGRARLLGVGAYEMQPEQWELLDAKIQKSALQMLLFVRNNDLYAEAIAQLLQTDRDRALVEAGRLRERMAHAIGGANELRGKLV